MATYNPLNDFNTYSYHHFLLLARTSELAETVADSDVFFNLINGTSPVDGIKVVVNPLTSNRYIIQELEWTNRLAGDVSETGLMAWCDGTFKLIEPSGINLMNDLYDIATEIDTTVDQSTWVLKTVFVGDTGVGDGVVASRYQYISNLRPILFRVQEVSLNFDEAGGEYTFSFILSNAGGSVVGADKAAFHQNSSVSLTSSTPDSPTTLAAALAKLEAHVNETQNKAYEQYLATPGPEPRARKIQYKIHWPPHFDRPHYTVSNPVRTSAGSDNSGAIITMRKNQGLAEAIYQVILRCPALVNEMPNTETQHIYRVIPTVKTFDGTSDIAELHTYHIVRVQVESYDSTDTAATQKVEETAESRGNLLEFDYIYTGKNLDVLSYDMKITAGLSYFSSVIAAAAARDDRSHSIASAYLTSKANVRKPSTNGAGVFYPPENTPPKSSHQPDPQAAVGASELLQFYSVMDVMTKIRIRGNSRLLHDITPATDVIATAVEEQPIPGQEGAASSWLNHPLRCKVNVMMPKDGDINNLQSFWYKGTYRVFSITNTFSAGEFTQELELMAEMTGGFPYTKDAPPAPPAATVDPVAVSGETATNAARVRAFMRMIRWAEGTAGDDGYTLLFGYDKFLPGADHPRILVTKNGYKSTAAGAYQINAPTWDDFRNRAKYAGLFPDFKPESQDKCCWAILDDAKALPLIRENKIKEAIELKKVGNRWASLPSSGVSQPKKPLGACLQTYNIYLAEEMKEISTLAADREALV